MRYLPNVLTLLRIVLIFPVVMTLSEQKFHITFCLFLFAGLTDILDGMLARRYGWSSRFGSILDPLADKFLLIITFIAFADLGLVSTNLVSTVIIRDVWIVSGCLLYYWLFGPYQMSPRYLGKLNTFSQIMLVMAILFSSAFISIPPVILKGLVYLVLIAAVASLIDYTWIGARRAVGLNRGNSHG